jgi:hypothetical protein
VARCGSSTSRWPNRSDLLLRSSLRSLKAKTSLTTCPISSPSASAFFLGLKLAGDTLMALGAWTHCVPWMVIWALLVVGGWSHGLLPRARPGLRSTR